MADNRINEDNLVKRTVYESTTGKYYFVIVEAEDTNTGDICVIYVELFGERKTKVMERERFLGNNDKGQQRFKLKE